MSTIAEYHLHFALVLLFAWAGRATAETRKFTLNQPNARTLGVWRLTHDPVIRDEGNYHNIQCWSPNGRYTCYTHWGGDDGPGGKGSAEIHLVDLKTGEDIIDQLSGMSREDNVTIISATHDHKMLSVSDRVVWIAGGRIDRVKRREDLNIELGSIQ